MNHRLLMKLVLVLALAVCLTGLTIALAQGDSPERSLPARPVPAEASGGPQVRQALREVAPQNDTPATAEQLQCGWTIDAWIDYAGDVDYYYFDAGAGWNLGAYVEAYEYGSTVDPVLVSYAPDGATVLEVSDDYDGWDPRLHFTEMQGGGRYYLRVTDYSDDSADWYRITLDWPIYVTIKSAGKIGNLAYKPGDILVYYACAHRWDMFFDASDVALAKNVQGIAVLDAMYHPPIFMTNGAAGNVPGLGNLKGQDAYYFIPLDVGWDTAGYFGMLFDGSDVGYIYGNQQLDALGVDPEGRGLLLSVNGDGNWPGLGAIKDEDILLFRGTSYGWNTAGTTEMWFDAGDIGWNKDTVGVFQNAYWWDLYMNTNQKVVLPLFGHTAYPYTLSFCWPSSLGWASSCHNVWTAIDFKAAGLGNKGVDGVCMGEQYWPVNFAPAAAALDKS